MSNSVTHLGDVSQVIQLVLAPAFLLTSIAGILNVMTGRLARIIDRGRHLAGLPEPSGKEAIEAQYLEGKNLEKRRFLASAAITACTLSALLTCMVIVVLFVKAMLGLEITWIVGVLFTTSTLALVVGLAYFLREVHLATKTIRIVLPQFDKKLPDNK